MPGMHDLTSSRCADVRHHDARHGITRRADLLAATPALLALLLAFAQPQQRLLWLALLLFAAVLASLFAPVWSSRGHWRIAPPPVLQGGRAMMRRALLLLALLAMPASLLLPLPVGLLLLLALRMGWAMCGPTRMPGFMFIDVALLAASLLALLPSAGG